METAKIVGRNIRAFRQWKGLSQGDLSKKCNLHRVYISSIERGAGNITLDNLTKIATALEIELHVLLMEGAYKWIKQYK